MLEKIEVAGGEPILRYVLKNGKCITDQDACIKLDMLDKEHPYTPKENSTGYTWDEMGLADLFMLLYKDKLLYCKEAKSWYVYDGKRWAQDLGNLQANEKMKEFFSLMFIYCDELKETEVTKAYTKTVHKFSTKTYREKILKDASSVSPVCVQLFDRNPYLLNCQNGTIDLRRVKFLPHQSTDYITQLANFSFSSAGDIDYIPEDQFEIKQRIDLHCPRWEQFIAEVTEHDKDKAKYLQTALGYSILGTSREECMFILWGKTTRNGKSTLLNAIQNLLGDYATGTPLDLICKSGGSKDLNSASPVLANLQGKRIAIMSESEEHGKLDESKVKTLTGGEEIACRRLYEAPFTYLPQFTMWLSCNDLPSAYDNSLFSSGRLKVIEFTRHFEPEEQDKTLKDYFRTEKAKTGIFYWLLTGCFRYLKEGLKEPPAIQEKVKEYQEDNDLILQFIGQCCEQRFGAYVKSSELFSAYRNWCSDNGYFAGTIRTFNKNVKLYLGDKNWHLGMSRYVVYDNIKLKDLNRPISFNLDKEN